MLYVRCAWTAFAKRLEKLVGWDLAHAAAPIVHRRRCRRVTLPLLTQTIERHSSNDHEEDESKGDTESDEDDEA